MALTDDREDSLGLFEQLCRHILRLGFAAVAILSSEKGLEACFCIARHMFSKSLCVRAKLSQKSHSRASFAAVVP